MEGLSIPRLARLQLHLPTYKDGTDPQTTPQRGRTPGLLPPQTELIHGLLHRRERPRGSATEGTGPQAPPHPEMVTEKFKKKNGLWFSVCHKLLWGQEHLAMSPSL